MSAPTFMPGEKVIWVRSVRGKPVEIPAVVETVFRSYDGDTFLIKSEKRGRVSLAAEFLKKV